LGRFEITLLTEKNFPMRLGVELNMADEHVVAPDGVGLAGRDMDGKDDGKGTMIELEVFEPMRPT
jgi:hypothetical protein